MRHHLSRVGVAYAAGEWALLVGYLAYIYLFRRSSLGRRFCPSLVRAGSRAALFAGWGELFALGLPGAWLLLFKWASLEVCLLQAGWLGSAELAAFVVLKNLSALAFQLASGLGIASHTLVGNAIGADKPSEARRMAQATYVASAAFAALQVCVLLLFRQGLGQLFTRDPALLANFTHVWWLLLLILPADTLQASAVALLRGVGRQADSTWSNGLAHVGVGLPLGYVLAFPLNKGLPGLLWGYLAGTGLAALALMYVCSRLDWEQLTRESKQRREREKQELLLLRSGGAGTASSAAAAAAARRERRRSKLEHHFAQPPPLVRFSSSVGDSSTHAAAAATSSSVFGAAPPTSASVVFARPTDSDDTTNDEEEDDDMLGGNSLSSSHSSSFRSSRPRSAADIESESDSDPEERMQITRPLQPALLQQQRQQHANGYRSSDVPAAAASESTSLLPSSASSRAYV